MLIEAYILHIITRKQQNFIIARLILQRYAITIFTFK